MIRRTGDPSIENLSEPTVNTNGSANETVESSTVISDDSMPQDRQPIEWDGSEDLKVLDATADLGDDLELARAEHVILSEMHAEAEAENNDAAVHHDFEVVGDVALEGSIASLNETLSDVTFDGKESFDALFEPSGEIDSDSIIVGRRDGNAECTQQSEPTVDSGARIDPNPTTEKIEVEHTHPAEINADAHDNVDQHMANSTTVSASEGEALSSKADDSSFFAKLWGAVWGMSGTKQRSQASMEEDRHAKRN